MPFFRGNHQLFLFCVIARRLPNIPRLISAHYSRQQTEEDGNRQRTGRKVVLVSRICRPLPGFSYFFQFVAALDALPIQDVGI